MIEREMLEDMFSSMQQDGVDTDRELLWGYFFTDRDASKLEAVIPELERRGFEFVKLMESEADETEDAYFFLHVERIESHTVDTLDALNQELSALADEYELDSYDGMDVGNPDGSAF